MPSTLGYFLKKFHFKRSVVISYKTAKIFLIRSSGHIWSSDAIAEKTGALNFVMYAKRENAM